MPIMPEILFAFKKLFVSDTKNYRRIAKNKCDGKERISALGVGRYAFPKEFNYGIRLSMYYFQPCFHRIGQVSNEEEAMLL